MLKKVVKKLELSKQKVSKKWYGYSVEKAKILTDDTLDFWQKKEEINNLLKVTRGKISGTWEGYRGEKYAITHRSDISEFSLTKKYVTKNTNQFFYKAKKDFDSDNLDDLALKTINKKNVIGILCTLKVKDLETDQIQYSTDLVTKNILDNIHNKRLNVYEHLCNKFKSMTTHVVEFELKSIHIRIIYEKTKKL